jgi:hypothetical protein
MRLACRVDGGSMPRGVLYVETYPSSPEREAEYREWYQTHMRELVAIDGIRSARHFAPLEADGPFVAIYEIETDDIALMRERMVAALERGEVTRSPALQTDPPAVSRLYTEIASYAP